MTIADIAKLLERLGCPPQKCEAMARQLDRKARMDADRRCVSYHVALQHLISLLVEGRAAQTRKTSPE